MLGYILAGVVIGPHTPPFPLISEQETIATLSELGVIFLMFSLGLEFSLRKLRAVGATAFIAASLEILVMVWAGYEAGRLFGWGTMDSVFLGAILSISSTTIIIKALEELGKTREKFAELIFGRCGNPGTGCDDAIPMFQVNADPSAQLLTMGFSLHVETEQMKRCVQQLKEALPGMNPGFRLLTNLSDLEEMEASCAVYVEEIMGLCNEKRISEVVRVIPDRTKDIGFNIMSQFHYSKDVRMRTYENLADAMESLAV